MPRTQFTNQTSLPRQTQPYNNDAQSIDHALTLMCDLVSQQLERGEDDDLCRMTDQPQHKWHPYVEIQPNEHLPLETHPLPPHLVDTELHAVCIC